MARTFYIIDGHAQIFRAYFAPFRDLSSPTGEPTKATYVFTQMLLNLIDQCRPDHLAMVIDQAGDKGTFREQIYPEYKANRQSPPDDFAPQAARILQIVRDAGVPIFAQEGVEADDVIATMARRLCSQGYEVMIVSKDKDLRQVLNDCVKMYDVQKNQVFDVATMEAELGYSPREAVEVQTLTGDATDNVPGIPGVGEKTAAKLIRKYGNVDEVLKHIDEMTPKMRENFEKYRDRLPLSRQLVTLKDNLDLAFSAEDCEFKGLNLTALRGHLHALGFTGLLKRLPTEDEARQEAAAVSARPPAAAAPGAPVKPKRTEDGRLLFRTSLFDGLLPPATAIADGYASAAECRYELIDTEDKLSRFMVELGRQKRFAFDTETDALGAMASNLIGMSFSWEPRHGFYVPVRGPTGSEHLPPERVLESLRPILENPAIGKIGHNIKYDLMVMRQAGIDLRGIVLDTMIAAFILDAGRLSYGIDRLSLELLRYQKIPTRDLIGRGKTQISMADAPLDQVATYAAEDADITFRLADLFSPKLDELPQLRKLNDELETPLIEVLAEMEANGVAIDGEILAEQSDVLGKRIKELRGEVMNEAGCDFNPDSPKQLADVLFGKLRLKVVKRTKTGPSTDVEVLEKLAVEHKVPRLILEYRGLVKLKGTYLDTLEDYVNPRTGRIHASFNQIGAATGRLSCSDPNLQNIPIRTDEGRRIRLAFVPYDRENNVLLTADYSQIELRVLAHFTEEPALLTAFENNEDIHAAVAAEVFGVPLAEVSRAQRNQAKIINFGIIYGVSSYGLARRIEGLTVKSAADLIAAYNKRFPSIQRFLNQCVQMAQSMGHVETILGRRRAISDISSAVLSLRNAGERMAINSVVQGSAADLIKQAMLNVHRRLKREKRPSRMLMQVHDELVFETPADEVEGEAAMITEEMTSAMKLKVPLRVEVGWGKNWQEGK